MLAVAEQTFADRLRALRKDILRVTQEEMAERLGVQRSVYKNWEYGSNMPPATVLERLHDMGMEASKERRQVMSKLRSGAVARLKVLGAIGAGTEPNSQPEPSELDSVPVEFARADYSGLVVEGDSMLPYLQPGDILVFKDSKIPKLNRIMAVRVDDAPELLVKRLVHGPEGWELHSANPAYKPIVATHKIECLGFLVGVIGDALRLGPDERGLDEQYIETHLRSRLPII